jgi:hypothetical protein
MNYPAASGQGIQSEFTSDRPKERGIKPDRD